MQGDPVAKTPSKQPAVGSDLSIVRTTISAVLAVVGIAWLVVYLTVGNDGKSLTWMYDLYDWNFLIGFGLFFLGLLTASHSNAPLGRGRGIVVGMLGSFLAGLVWIVVYYMTGNMDIPVISDLGNYNLLVGVAFMASGFVFATKWE